MKKILLVVPVLLIIVGIGIYFRLVRENRSVGEQPQKDQVLTADTGTLADLLAVDESSVCSFSAQDDSFSGTYYTNGENFASELSFFNAEEMIYGIYQEDSLYFWNQNDLVGTSIFSEDKVGLIDYDFRDHVPELYNDINFSCDEWTVDYTKFIVPENIEFIDINRILEQVGTGVGGINQIQCAACDEYENFQDIVSCKEALQCD